MLLIGPIGFLTPWLLAALAALPALWLILRAMPPSPRLVRFPGTRLLLGLRDPHPVARHTPWWLLLLRVLAVAALILGFAGPVWKPAPDQGGQGPLLIVMDAGWAAAPDWPQRQARALRALERAAAAGQPAALLVADGREDGALAFQPAPDLAAQLRALRPASWETRYPPDPAAALAGAPAGLSALWLSDGLDHPGRAEWLAALSARAALTVVPPEGPRQSLELAAGDQPALRLRSTGAAASDVLAIGRDPQGMPRELARLKPGEGAQDRGVTSWPVPIDLPSELRNRITRFEVEGQASAGAVLLADDSLRRRKVALVGDDRAGEGQRLLSPLHYLRRALAPSTDLIEGGMGDVLQAAPDVIVLADQIGLADTPGLREWVEQGGLLIRFAGPRMAASERLAEEPLLPVRLRAGGRDIGGALAWGEPRGVAEFAADGPFAGLAVPADVAVRAQLLAEPAPDLGDRVIARLSDGTPLVTRAALGQGQLVLFHTTANAEWSNLAISGLFVEMLDRLVRSARVSAETPEADPAEQPFWLPELVLDGFGRAAEPGDPVPVAAADFARGPAPAAPAGLYRGGERMVALNAGGPMAPADWPGIRIERAAEAPGLDLRGWLVALAALLLALDALGSAWLARGRRGAMA
ncbi:N-terminal double-transmembrane domain-containing protein [Paracoccus thiocyanatus]|uniref:N-terminal double-transmembrane domain-containing protein n=1 Tax=Paracoccus thiocyanatus TaxID=34006 RepID=A0A1N6P6M3_9RHOB|nr:BatA domain-containing protein [Paracoccus thiocyanatus]SIP99965.1 N-terminal double-transmembrane domain-containing protein [Paracoccus thiocyanatus]